MYETEPPGVTELSGYVERAFRRNGIAYFVVSVPCPTSRNLDARREFKIPVKDEVYKRYENEIRDSKKSDSEHYVTISGNLEVKVEEYAAF